MIENLRGELLVGIIGIITGLLAGAVRYLARLEAGKTKFSITMLLTSTLISGFVGLLVAYACIAFDVNWALSGFLSGIIGSKGTDGIMFLFEAAKSRIKIQ